MGKIPTRVDRLGVDLLSIAGHKLYAPKGVGALYVRAGTSLEPLLHGAGHESGRRAGTESALLTTALGAACRIAADLSEMPRITALRDRLGSGVEARFGAGVVLNGHPQRRLPNTLNCSFIGANGGEILAGLDGVAASAGSACHSGQAAPSPVLQAMGIADPIARGAIRFSPGRETIAEEIVAVVQRLPIRL